MGLFWDLLQQSQISTQSSRADSIEARVEQLERELSELKQRQTELLILLERHFGEDINQDGKIGE